MVKKVLQVFHVHLYHPDAILETTKIHIKNKKEITNKQRYPYKYQTRDYKRIEFLIKNIN